MVLPVMKKKLRLSDLSVRARNCINNEVNRQFFQWSLDHFLSLDSNPNPYVFRNATTKDALSMLENPQKMVGGVRNCGYKTINEMLAWAGLPPLKKNEYHCPHCGKNIGPYGQKI
jgi:hypothetical protein